jgi:glycosyltransferase involved in cell wall biosynthesis
MPTVSVIIPCYKYGHWVTGCVQSLLSNRGVELDILVIDDCSPDDSWETVKRLPELDPRIRVERNEVNRGVVPTCNDAVAAAKGDYVVLISADDGAAPGWLDRAVAHLEANADATFAYGPYAPFSDAFPEPDTTTPENVIVYKGHDWLRDRCADGLGLIASPEVVVRTSAQHRVGGFGADMQYSGDMEMWMRLASIGDVVFAAGPPAAYYRVHAGSMQQSAKRRYIDGIHWAYAAHRAWHRWAEENGEVADRDVLYAMACQAIARRALRRALVAFMENPRSDQIDELCAIAAEIDPAAAPAARRLRAASSRPALRALARLARPAARVAFSAARRAEYRRRTGKRVR